MQQKLRIISLIVFTGLISSFFISPELSPNEKIKAYYRTQLKLLSEKLLVLKAAAEHQKDEKTIQEAFLQAKLCYKRIELFIEYYLELDAPKFNGLPNKFIEEEDPDALQEPQGFQVIESFIYPHYHKDKEKGLLLYINKLSALATGIKNNEPVFKPDDYILTATTEELYRIIALGITGFDSPVAQTSLPESAAALTSVQFVVQSYQPAIIAKKIDGYANALQLLQSARQFLLAHNNFNSFNRMEFIVRFMNPLCNWLGSTREKLGYGENPARYTLIKKTASLFSEKSLQRSIYMGDDTLTEARIALGKKLFYEPLLSVNGRRSCAGCHQPAKAFTDGLPKAMQLDEHSTLPRNTPTLWNAALQKNLFYDSRQTSLDHLVMEVLGNDQEMNKGAVNAIEKIKQQNEYLLLYRKAYPFADSTITDKKIVNALAMYVRTLVSYNSRFDNYMRGQANKMTSVEINGFNLFMGKAKCGTCHYAPLFNGTKPPVYYYQESEVLGVPASADTLHPVIDNDPGRITILHLDFFDHAFKTPTLRNIALTAPYMHNGIYKTLEEVIDFYNRGGGQGLGLAVPNQTLPPDKLGLTTTEKTALKAFLLTLTDTSGVH